MGERVGLRVAVTGAAGFIGRAVVERLERGALGAIAQLRLNDVQAFTHRDAIVVQGSCAEAGVRGRLVDGGIDVLFHLASLPGGAAERDPALGRAQVGLQSVDTAADNIIHAALMPAAGLSPQRAWTLPAMVAPIGSVVDALRHRTGHALRVAYGNAATHQPPVDAGTAPALGFASDGDAGSLIDAVLARLARGGARATEPARPR